jgi:GT2 family glycosyltransferase
MAKQISTSKPLTYSIVIIVKNDRGIATTLAALKPLVSKRKNVETIVIDASHPATLYDIQLDFPWVKWLEFVNTTDKRITIPEQRNMGIKQATGDVIAFLDSDCQPGKSWFKTLEKAFTTEGLNAVTGPITSLGEATAHDTGYATWQDGQVIPECGAANLAIRAKVLRKLGGFDNNMTYGEDVDLTWRLREAGYQLICKKAMSIGFYWGETKLERKRAFRYGTSRATLYKKHPSNWRNLLGQDINVVIYPLFIIGLPLTIWFPYYPLLILVPLARNLRSHPFQTTGLHLLYACGVIKGIFKNL